MKKRQYVPAAEWFLAGQQLKSNGWEVLATGQGWELYEKGKTRFRLTPETIQQVFDAGKFITNSRMKKRRFLKNRAHASASTPAPKRKKKAKAAGKVTRTDVKSTTIVRKNPRKRKRNSLTKYIRGVHRTARARSGPSKHTGRVYRHRLKDAERRREFRAQMRSRAASKRDREPIERALHPKTGKRPYMAGPVGPLPNRRRKRSARKSSCSYLAVRQGSKIMLARVQNSKAKRLGTFSMGGLRRYCAKHGIKMR